MIFPIYQPLGSSTHLLAEEVGRRVGEPATHTGTLDPMAEGVIVVTTGADRYSLPKSGQGLKEYSFQVVTGLVTDTHDLLGIAQKKDILQKPEIILKKVSIALDQLRATTTQVTPNFSSARSNGSSYFKLAKNGENILGRNEEILIKSLKMTHSKTILQKDLFTKINTSINKINGDFRQEQIIQTWKKILSEAQDETQLISLKATVSKRTYIRGIVRDLSQLTGIPMTTYHILRSKNGSYSLEDCVSLV